MKSSLLFSAWPYVSVSLLVVGVVVRYLLERKQIPAVKEAISEQWPLLGG